MRHPEQAITQASRQLAMQIDGVPLRGGAPANYTLQAVLASFRDEDRQRLRQIRDAVGPEIGVIDSHFDDAPLLLRQLGFRTRGIAGEDLGETELRVVAISCPHRHARLDEVDTLRFLKSGGVLLTSDRAIRVAGVSKFLGHLPGRPPARARLAFESCSPHGANAPVWLDAGHVPIDPASLDPNQSATIAHNTLTGDPLVTWARVGGGGILHSVAHWLQSPHSDRVTSVELLSLRSVPAYRSIGNSFPGITLGAFLAQRAMVELLLQGLATAFDQSAHAEHPRFERGK